MAAVGETWPGVDGQVDAGVDAGLDDVGSRSRTTRAQAGSDPYAATVDSRSLTFDADGVVLRVVGSVDEDIVHLLQQQLADHVATHRGQDVWVDLDRVDFLPSAGIGALVAAQGAALRTGGLLTLVAAPGSLPARVFGLMGIEHDATGPAH